MDVLWGSRRYISADVLAPYSPLEVVITRVNRENVAPEGEPPRERLTMEFECELKGEKNVGAMVLNATNTLILAELLGRDSAGWIGKTVKLTVGDAIFMGKACKAVRVVRA